MQYRYTGKTIFVLGGTRGIGMAIARLFVEQGANVLVFSRSEVHLKDAIVELEMSKKTKHQQIAGFPLDVTIEKEVYSALHSAVSISSIPDYLINTVGYAYPGYFEEIPPEQFRAMMEVNYFGTLYPIRTLLPMMKRAGGSRIVNTASLSGIIPIYGYGGYAPAKCAVIGLSKVLRSELRVFGIGVSVLCPPDIDTPGFEVENRIKPDETKEISRRCRLLKPEQVAVALEKGIRRGRFWIIPGFDGKIASILVRFFPSWADRLTMPSKTLQTAHEDRRQKDCS